MNRAIKYVLLATGLLMAATSQADLFRVGPNDLPSPPGHGYPQWYQDTNGLALDLCIPQTLNQLDPCLATPLPGEPLPSLPFVFPDNWSDEFFWFAAESILDMGNGESALLVQAVEAAFALGPPAIGDQIAFSRIRIRFVVPVDGNYTVTYPYGEEKFANQATGDRLFYTSDVGIGAPGDFTGALKGAIGPFLWAVDRDAAGTEVAKAYFPIDGDTFLADPLTETQVAGAPFGNNFFRVCVDVNPGISAWTLTVDASGASSWCVSTDGFALIGKVHDQIADPIASPLSVTRATYSTHMGMTEAHVDVFASAEAGPGELTPNLTVGMVGAPSAHMDGPRDPGGLYYGQGVVSAASLPSSVTVINSADTPPSSTQRALVDAITIMDANYDATNRILSVMAMSSDMLGDPTLSVIGIPGSVTGSDELVGGALTVGGLPYTLPLGTVPPRTLTVVSNAGGSATATVTMPSHGITYPTGAPLAVDDFVSVGESAALAANFDILANDGAEANPSTCQLVTTPIHGTATVNLIDGSVDYTPNAGYFGEDSFRYTVSSASGLSSNVATVTIDVVQINDAPVANDDIASSPIGTTAVTVNVVANDTDPDGIAPAPGGLDPASVAINSVSLGALATANGDGTVTFTKGTCGPCSFTYTVSDLGGLESNVATVAVSTAGNLAPIANPDAASLLVNQSITINVAANDSDPDGNLDLASIIVSTPPANGSAIGNPDGTVTYGAGPNSGTVTFGYTIADDLVPAARSGEAVVTVTVNPNPDTLRVQRAQCKADKNEWRVDGTSSILTPHSVTVYRADGSVLTANIPVDNLGEWRISKSNTSAACASPITIKSSLGGTVSTTVSN